MPRSTPRTFVVFIPLALSQIALAALSLQDLQPIAHFPPSCEAAYEAPIQQCPPASSFSLTGSDNGDSVCTQDCFNALNRATTNIQLACQGTAAPPGTVIAHAFYGDLATWLCSLGSQSSSQPASAGNPSVTASATSNTSPASPSDASSTSQSLSASSSSSTNSVSSTESTSATSVSSTSGSSSATTVTTQTTKSKSSTTKTSTSSTSTSIFNDGSPFDQTAAPNAAPTPIYGQNILSLAVGVVFAVAIGS